MVKRKKICDRESEYNREIGRRIDRLRRERRVKRAHLVEASGLTQQKLFSYEAGLARWPVFRLRLIADYLKVSMDEIIPKSQQYYVNSPMPQNLF